MAALRLGKRGAAGLLLLLAARLAGAPAAPHTCDLGVAGAEEHDEPLHPDGVSLLARSFTRINRTSVDSAEGSVLARGTVIRGPVGTILKECWSAVANHGPEQALRACTWHCQRTYRCQACTVQPGTKDACCLAQKCY
mmetsp:Transcript_92402/g.288017  ORF Transcript_92402/g.288017 Transcript_92402/m.288017 type:complete len:138 (+) Transcript_92402:59-472(+)